MRITTNIERPLELFLSSRSQLLAALDVEWTKNYRIHNGSRPFCYSMVFLPSHIWRRYSTTDRLPVWFRSVYVTDMTDESLLLRTLDADLKAVLGSGSVLAGHQLSSDLTTVLRAAPFALPYVENAYRAWRTRQSSATIFDTRYDINHLALRKSRRLVDVCADIQLDVTQPELAAGSMTRLHQLFLATGEESFRERLITLNLRHSLSTAVLAGVALGMIEPGTRNANRYLFDAAREHVAYVRSEQFQPLLKQEKVAQ